MSARAIVPFLALLLGSATLVLNAQKVKKTTVVATSPASGIAMYNEYCAVCHGRAGKGDGPAAAALNRAPTDLTMLTMHNKGKFPENKVYGSILGEADTPAHGSKDMPVWGGLFQDMSHGNSAEVQMRIGNLTHYIAGLQAK